MKTLRSARMFDSGMILSVSARTSVTLVFWLLLLPGVRAVPSLSAPDFPPNLGMLGATDSTASRAKDEVEPHFIFDNQVWFQNGIFTESGFPDDDPRGLLAINDSDGSGNCNKARRDHRILESLPIGSSQELPSGQTACRIPTLHLTRSAAAALPLERGPPALSGRGAASSRGGSFVNSVKQNLNPTQR